MGRVVSAVGLFAVTNVDDLVLLGLFFGRAAGRPWRVVAGQYAGFAVILVAAVAGALGAGLLPEAALPWLGLVPIALGLRAGWRVWRPGPDDGPDTAAGAPGVLAVAGVTAANGGDNLGVYVPVFSQAGPGGTAGYVAVFLVLVGVWCLAGRLLVSHRAVAAALTRWGHLLLPPVLVAIGLAILLGG